MQHKTIIGETVEIKSFGEIYRKLLTTSHSVSVSQSNPTAVAEAESGLEPKHFRYSRSCITDSKKSLYTLLHNGI